MFAALLVAAAVVVGSRLGASVAVAANGRPAAATRSSPGNPQAVPPILAPATQCAPAAGFPAATTPVAFWSTEARCAIVPPTAGPENFGNKFPGEAAVYMGIVHVAIYDAAVAIEGGYRPFLPTPPRRRTPRPRPRSRRQRTTPSSGCSRRSASMPASRRSSTATMPPTSQRSRTARRRANGLAVGQQIAAAVIAWRANDGRDNNPTVADLNPPAPGPGVWQPNAPTAPARPHLRCWASGCQASGRWP